MANKFSKSIGKIYKCSLTLSKSGLKSLYYSMVYPYLFYCNIVWASTYKTNLLLTCSSCDSTKVRDQKYNKSAFDASLDPIYKEHRRLKLLDIRLLELGKFMYSYKRSLLPIRFRNTFPLNNQTHNYNTRNAVAFKLPFCRTNTRQFSASYQERVLNTLRP